MNPLPLLPLDLGQDFAAALDALMQPIYWAISGVLVGFHWLYSHLFDPNRGVTWVLSIISLTVVVRTLLIPLFVRQINSARKMQLIAPKMKALQDKFGTDRERLAQEQMKLYREEGVNPFASCLPLFLQMPIFIGLFNVLNGVSNGVPVGHFFFEGAHQNAAGQMVYPLVDSLRNASVFGASLAGKFMPFETWGPNQWLAGFLIIAMTVTLFITQLQMMRKNMPPEALTGPMAQQQKMMLYIFPIMYLFFGISVPIGVMVYWFASNLWTLGQQWILIHNSPSPNTPAYVDWEERMRAKGLDPDAVLRKRLGMDKGPRTTVVSDPTKVARQSASAPAPRASRGSTKVTSEVARENVTFQQPPADQSGRQRIQRQQPTRNSRAARKKN